MELQPLTACVAGGCTQSPRLAFQDCSNEAPPLVRARSGLKVKAPLFFPERRLIKPQTR